MPPKLRPLPRPCTRHSVLIPHWPTRYIQLYTNLFSQLMCIVNCISTVNIYTTRKRSKGIDCLFTKFRLKVLQMVVTPRHSLKFSPGDSLGNTILLFYGVLFTLFLYLSHTHTHTPHTHTHTHTVGRSRYHSGCAAVPSQTAGSECGSLGDLQGPGNPQDWFL